MRRGISVALRRVTCLLFVLTFYVLSVIAFPVHRDGVAAWSKFLTGSVNIIIATPGDTIYYDEDGTEIGRFPSRNNTNVSYVLKTTKSERDVYLPCEWEGNCDGRYGEAKPIPVRGISRRDSRRIKKKVKEKFVDDEDRKFMVQILDIDILKKIYYAIPDMEFDSSGYREYGAIVDYNGDFVLQKGKAVPPGTAKSYLELKGKGLTEFHTHPSASEGFVPTPHEDFWDKHHPGSREKHGTSNSAWFMQGPSDIDQKNLSHEIGYVFAMRVRQIYIYNKEGIIATLPIDFDNKGNLTFR